MTFDAVENPELWVILKILEKNIVGYLSENVLFVPISKFFCTTIKQFREKERFWWTVLKTLF